MNRIKEYFKEQIKTDEALRNVYSESKLKACWDYIMSQARKQAKDGCAMIDEAVVYHWARDYMFGDIPAAEKKAENVGNSPVEEVKAEITEENAEISEEKADISEGIPEEISVAEEEEKKPAETVQDFIDQKEKETITEPAKTENKRTCGNCGYAYEGKCLNYGSGAINPDSPACKEYAATPTPEQMEAEKHKLTILSVEQDKPKKSKKEKSKPADDSQQQFLFDFD